MLDWPAVFLCCNVLPLRLCWSHKVELEIVPSFFVPCRSLHKIDVIFSLNAYKNLLLRPFEHLVFFVGGF